MSPRLLLAALASLAAMGLAQAQPAPGTPVRINATIVVASTGLP